MGCTQGTVQAVQSQRVEVVQRKSFYDVYTLDKKLGSGAFAQVRIAIHKDYSHDESSSYAVKIIDLRHNKDKVGTERETDNVDHRLRMDAKCEAALWRRVTESKNPFCIKLEEVFWDNACCYMVMERCDSTLLHELEQAQHINELTLSKIFQQTCHAVAGLHQVSVVHRDIKPDNLLINKGCRVKLGDFGLSTVMQQGSPLTEIYGTAPFMSPEMLREARYNEKTDIWSVGVLMYVLLFGQFPYYSLEKSSKAMKMAIRDGKMLPSFRPWKGSAEDFKPSSAMESLVRNMIARDPSKRLSAPEVVGDKVWNQLSSPQAHSNAPSLRPMLQGAIRAGAFSVPRRNKEESKDATDMLLSELSRKSGYTARRSHGESRNSRTSRLGWEPSMGRSGTGSSSQPDPSSPGRKKVGGKDFDSSNHLSLTSTGTGPAFSGVSDNTDRTPTAGSRTGGSDAPTIVRTMGSRQAPSMMRQSR